jgi:hypothetical protein
MRNRQPEVKMQLLDGRKAADEKGRSLLMLREIVYA